jgi:hypothetical protein
MFMNLKAPVFRSPRDERVINHARHVQT